ncbi:hypothetical protein PL9631_20004 [Planktothrix paucivesiculata PCC 9631]|uniref:Uncharacterized protein n=1 Tax=Planktothrix paucivesiculata PCC 9631 TaxID=671071 RepID=A0A7Z9DYM2_9CYAN|nr:hypothetical protein PL9631_20004 [Planktothrix paucivesiculata PCC 9631]
MSAADLYGLLLADAIILFKLGGNGKISFSIIILYNPKSIIEQTTKEKTGLLFSK